MGNSSKGVSDDRPDRVRSLFGLVPSGWIPFIVPFTSPFPHSFFFMFTLSGKPVERANNHGIDGISRLIN